MLGMYRMFVVRCMKCERNNNNNILIIVEKSSIAGGC